jgi:hypothetical protein
MYPTIVLDPGLQISRIMLQTLNGPLSYVHIHIIIIHIEGMPAQTPVYCINQSSAPHQ